MHAEALRCQLDSVTQERRCRERLRRAEGEHQRRLAAEQALQAARLAQQQELTAAEQALQAAHVAQQQDRHQRTAAEHALQAAQAAQQQAEHAQHETAALLEQALRAQSDEQRQWREAQETNAQLRVELQQQQRTQALPEGEPPEPELPLQPPPLAALFASDPEAFWARVGEGCEALAAVRAACAARPTEAGGDCRLNLFDKHIGDGGAAALGRALEGLPRPLPYTAIILGDTGLGPAGVRSVARGLRLGYGGGGGGRSLEVLDLYNNPFGGDAKAVGALAAALPPTLKELGLGSVGLGDAGLGALLPPFRALPALEGLTLHANELGAEGFGALGAALPSWGALQELFLYDNPRAGSAGVRKLAAALPRAPSSLATLDVSDCGADAAAVAELERAAAAARMQGSRLTNLLNNISFNAEASLPAAHHC
eukprot:COSAG01_NODE_9226_length_2513_cov_2.409279_1_plen_427_part_00